MKFLNSFEFIKDYIIKCIYNKINSYADSIQFYVENNLQTVESSSKTKEAAYEAKIQELNEKENELNKLKIEIEKMQLNMKDKEKEYNSNLLIAFQKYEDLKNDNEKIIEEKNLEIKKLEEKNKELNLEIKNIYMERNNKDDLSKIKNENIQLKVDLSIKDKEIKALNSKLNEIERIKRKQSNIQETMGDDILKENDIPKLKEMFKTINKTISDYSEKIDQLEKNKNIVFDDKFIEINKSDWKKTYKNWNDELRENNYTKEISELQKENNNFINELSSLCNNVNNKNIEIIKLNQKIQSDKEIFEIKQGEIKDILKKCDKIQKELDIYKVRFSENEKKLQNVEGDLGKYKSKANIVEGQIENILGLINSMMIKDKKIYSTHFNQIQGEYKKIFIEFNKAFGIFK